MATPAEVAKKVLQVQDACNLTGVMNLSPEVRQAVIDLTPEGGTDRRNQHPLFQIFIFKLAALAGFEPLDWPGYLKAYQEVQRIAGEELIGPVDAVHHS